MKLILKSGAIFLICATLFSLSACSTTSMKVSDQSKPGFSNITDIPLPESANIDMNKSMVMGGNNVWTGHLVYYTNKPQAEVVDFINSHMQNDNWTKISELRGKETIISFMKKKRVATIRILTEESYFSKKTMVSVDMTSSKFKAVENAIIQENEGVERT